MSVARSVEDPLRVNQVNVTGTLNLLKAAAETGVRAVRLRVVLLRLRRHRDPSEERVDGDGPVFALRGLQAGGRELLQGLREGLRPEDRLAEILQRLRPSAKKAASTAA